MVVKKRDFQKIAGLLHEFLSKLSCEESTAALRDSIKLALFYMQTYYKTLRTRSLSNSMSPRTPTLGGSLIFNGGVSPVSPACGVPDQFEWKWYNLESPRLSASLGTDEFSCLPPILQAGKSGDPEFLKELIAKDPEVVQQVDGLGRNAAMYCVHGNSSAHTECLEILVNTDCDLNLQANDDTAALHVAAHDNNTSALRLLLKRKASCNVEDNQGRTPVHWAAANSSVENVKLLLQSGGNLNAEDREGLTPAMWACHFNQVQNLQVLQEALSRIDPEEDALFGETDHCGQSVIHWAVKGLGSLECLEALLTDQTALLRDNEGKTVLHTAAEQGNVAACEMIIEVRGAVESLQDTDKTKRTPLHLAAICGQGEVVNFLLDRGADLLAEDAFGASALDYVHNKQLNYCTMVVQAHPQYSQHKPDKDDLASKPATTHGQEEQTKGCQPSAPPIEEVWQENYNTKAESFHGKGSINEQNNDVSELHGFDVQGGTGSVDILEKNERNQWTTEKTKSKNESISKTNPDVIKEATQDKSSNKNRRQSTLTRQGGFHAESDSREAPSFDLRTEDGNVLVVVSNLDNDDEQEQIIDVEDGDIEIDCEDNFEYSSMRLQQGRGSASSVHSEPDNADNCSVSVGLSVSSLGSDNEEVIHEDDCEDRHGGGERQEQEELVYQQQQISPESNRSSSQHLRQMPSQFQSSPREIPSSTKPTQQASQVQAFDARDRRDIPASNSNFKEEKHDVPPKKKKDKSKKKKQKGSQGVELPAPLPPPRGFVAPLNPSTLGPTGAPKLGALKPGPWEHSGLAPLRQTPPEPSPPSPRMGRSSEFPRGYPHHGEFFDSVDRNSSDGGFERPRTPEPPRSPHEVGGQQPFYPSPPNSSRGASDVAFRGPMEGGLQEREMNYGPPGPPHGPLAHANGQGLLRNTDMMGRSPKMETWPGKNLGHTNKGGAIPHGSPGQQTFTLHGPMPHPPHR